MLSKRIEAIRKSLRETPPSICIERGRLVTNFYKKPCIESIVIRKAKLFQYILENMTIYIGTNDLLAGNQSSKFRSVAVFPELGAGWMLREIDTFEKRETDPLSISQKDKEELIEILTLWNGNSLNDIINEKISKEVKTAEQCGLLSVGSRNTSTGHIIPDYNKLLSIGLNGIIAEATNNLKNAKTESNEMRHCIDIWESIIITCQAAISFANRYADLAEKESENCMDGRRKAELLKIAENCRNVPGNPPQTFYEALQFVWFIHLCIQIESNGHGISFGRLDQYLYPFFQADKEKGILSDMQCVEFLESLWLKCTELIKIRDAFDSQAFSSYPMWQNITIGGQTSYGKDACNRLTNLILDATDEVETIQPSVSFRYHRHICQKTFKHALKLTQRGLATPAFFNDELVISIMLAKGATVKEARNWAVLGCVEPYVPGKTDGRPVVGYINTAKLVEITLNNGYDPVTKQQLGPKTGDARFFLSMEDFMEAYEKQMQYFNDMMLDSYNTVTSIHAQIQPTIFCASLIEGCVEKGMTLQEGGAKYNFSGTFVTGLANAVDSMAAIQEILFNKKYINMEELLDLLNSNFEGNENMRQLLLNKAPKFGNDIDEVDIFANIIIDMITSHTDHYRDSRGGRYVVSILSQSFNVLQGKNVGATPDGRKAYTPLSDNASPAASRDVKGPTATVRSVSKIDQMLPLTGTLLNQKFDPLIIKGEYGLSILDTIIRTYFENLGEHIQINVIDKETLYNAQKYPERHPNLMVRVAGYSAYFINLDKEVQQDIINRTEQTGL